MVARFMSFLYAPTRSTSCVMLYFFFFFSPAEPEADKTYEIITADHFAGPTEYKHFMLLCL